jgi:uncharacterized protein YkuJ
MTVSEQFIKNLKAVSDTKIFTHDEIKLIALTIQELATVSPLEVISIMDHLDELTKEAAAEMPQDEFDALKKELFEDLE